MTKELNWISDRSPSKRGVYPVKHANGSNRGFRYWNLEFWGNFRVTYKDALEIKEGGRRSRRTTALLWGEKKPEKVTSVLTKYDPISTVTGDSLDQLITRFQDILKLNPCKGPHQASGTVVIIGCPEEGPNYMFTKDTKNPIANAMFFATCSPENIQQLTDEILKLRRQLVTHRLLAAPINKI